MTDITALLLALARGRRKVGLLMKRFLFAAVAGAALLVPAPASAQVKTIYIPGAHPRVVVVQPENQTAKVEKAALTPAEVIERHAPMAAARRGNPRVNHSAVAHCDRLVAQARAELRKNF